MSKINNMKEENKTINFTQVSLTDLVGNIDVLDVGKLLGNYIYKMTGDLGMFDTAKAIYDKGEVELSEDAKKEILNLLKDPRCTFIAILKQELINMLSAKE